MKERFSGFLNIRGGLKTRSFRVGGYSVAALVIVLAIAVMANVLVSSLPSSWTQLDLTANRLYSLSGQTQSVVSSLEEDVTVYWIVQQGQEETTVETLLSRYEDLSEHLKVVKKDPDVYPTFARQYTSERVYNNSLIVESARRSRYLSYADFYEYDYSNYYSTGTYDVSFAGEGLLTSAIRSVTDDAQPVLYTLTGHGEAELSTAFQSAIEKENFSVETLSLLTVDEIPEDAACLLLNAPLNDISGEELDMLLSWLRSGGKLILLTDPPEEGSSRPNLDALTEAYGMTETPGIVLETNRNCYAFGAPYYLLPELQYHSITSPLREDGYYVLLPIAHGLSAQEELREGLSVTELLTSSSESFSKTEGYTMSSYDRAEGDPDGPFALALLAEEGESGLLWISSASLLQDQVNQQVAGGNQDFFLNCLSYLCEQEEAISIHPKSVSYDYLTMDSGTASRLSALLVFVIPACVLAVGIVIRIRRKSQ